MSGRGGKRYGAGRKPDGAERKVQKTVMLKAETFEYLSSQGVPLGVAIDDMLADIKNG